MAGQIVPYDWALQVIRAEQAHSVTTGSKDIVVAVIDLGYRDHAALTRHLWVNPYPTKGDIHGWDCADDDASLAYAGAEEITSPEYYRGHHTFIVGEVAAVAPACPIMVVRVGYGKRESWPQAIRYAADHGARVIIMPHGYINGEAKYGVNLFDRGVDFAYPQDNPELMAALDYAYDRNCLVFSGTADNRGRRVAVAAAGHEAVIAVGSANKEGRASDICCSADYVEVGAPAGQRFSGNPEDEVWGYGGDNNIISFTGGCMACGFAGAAAALVMSRYPHLSNEQIRQIMRNTSRPPDNAEPDDNGWEPRLGYGIVDVHAAVSLTEDELRSNIQLEATSVRVHHSGGKWSVTAVIANKGAYDAKRAIVVVYNGDPTVPPNPEIPLTQPVPQLQIRQVGHTLVPVRGFYHKEIHIQLVEQPKRSLWFEVYCLDRHDNRTVRYYTISVAEEANL